MIRALMQGLMHAELQARQHMAELVLDVVRW